jgi:predicted permease
VAERLTVSAEGQADALRAVFVSGRYFEGLGVAPAAGRLIQADDDASDSATVVVLSHRFSERRYGRVAAAVGRTVRINERAFTVVGVAPAGFFGAEPGAIPDVFVPLHADTTLRAAFGPAAFTDEHYYWLEVMARLLPGMSREEAQTALAPRFRQFVEGTATTDAQRGDLPSLAVQAGATGLDGLRRQYVQPIAVLSVLVALILIVACSNIASLLLSRATARRREIAVRLGIGASRSRLIRQLLTESLLLATIGGAIGVAVAWWGIRTLTVLLANGRENFTLHAELNWTVLVAALTLTVLAGVASGLAPALQATRVNLAPALAGSRIGGDGRRRFGLTPGRTLVVVQIALSLVLLVGAALFGRTLANLHAIEVGFDRDKVLLFTVRPSSIGYRGPELFGFYDRLREELRRIPGVTGVTLSARPFPTGTVAGVEITGAKPVAASSDRDLPGAFLATVGPGFFATMGIPLLGRDVGDADTATSVPVVVVNRLLAADFGLANPLGRALVLGDRRFEIVGVADDALAMSLTEEPRSIAYFPHRQGARPPTQMTFAIRTATDPTGFAGPAREAVRRVDARLPIQDLKTQATHIDQAISTEITLARLCTALAALALVIACVGLYGTVSFGVSRRTSEIGIRMTLGAQRRGIVWMVLREVCGLTAVGLVIGVPLALAGSQYVRSLLYGIEPADPAALALAAGALIVCGLAAGAVPAHRASRIDPLAAVRHE